jgi:hypothetical protein
VAMGVLRKPPRLRAGTGRDIPAHRRRATPPRPRRLDTVGAILASAGMLLLVYALVKAPDVGWGKARTIGELAGAAVALFA